MTETQIQSRKQSPNKL